MAKSIMIQGTMSSAGKSFLAAGLCRIFHQDGYRVAPFKSQNMALNSYITKEGLEMGRAQVFQAQAAGVEPSADMNPVLLKPSSNTASQVVVNGIPRSDMPAREYFRYKKKLVPDIMAAYGRLAARNDIIVIEGAGSPAEINLKENDIVNMGLAEMVDAPVLLAGDIDRGGVFAQLYGTAALLEDKERARLKGFVINKFRGDPSLLGSGITMLEEKTGIPVLGVVPYLEDIDLEDEDSLAERLKGPRHEGILDIVVVRLPRISNFTDFYLLESSPAVTLRYVNHPQELGHPDLVILPGTKSTISDLKWLRESGMEMALRREVSKGTPLFGICGGFQMMGQRILDPEGAEGGGKIRGLGYFPSETVFRKEKRRARVRGRFGKVGGPLAALSGKPVDGYEIHMGRTEALEEYRPLTEMSDLQVQIQGINGPDNHGSRQRVSEAENPGSQPVGEGKLGNGIQSTASCPSAYVPSIVGEEKLGDGTQSTGQDGFQSYDPHAEGLRTECGFRQEGMQCGNVYGSYVHGIFDQEEAVEALLSALSKNRGIDLDAKVPDQEAYREEQFDHLAKTLRESMDMDAVYRITGL